MKKRLAQRYLPALLIVCVLLGCFPISAFAKVLIMPSKQVTISSDVDITKILKDNVLDYTIQGDWIYYIHETYRTDYAGDPAKGPIYKIKKDGTGNVQIVKDEVPAFGVIGSRVYYLLDHQIHAVGTDGSNDQLIKIDYATSIWTVGGYLFYVDNQTPNLYRFDPATNTSSVFSTDQGYFEENIQTINGSWLYITGYDDANDKPTAYLIKPDGSDKKSLVNLPIYRVLNVTDSNVYYTSRDDNDQYTLNLANVDVTSNKKIADLPEDCILHVQTTPEYFLFSDWQGKFTRIGYDGKVLQSAGAPASTPSGGALSDIQNHWARASIERLVEAKILTGYSDGTFKPEGNITREEFVTVLVKAKGYDTSSTILAFHDIDGSRWSAPYISAALQAGVISAAEYSNNFSPTKAITREEMAVMVAKAMKLKEDASAAAKFKDIGASKNKGWIGATVNAGIISGVTSNTFVGADTATRAQTAVIITRMLDYKGDVLPKSNDADEKSSALMEITPTNDGVFGAAIGDTKEVLIKKLGQPIRIDPSRLSDSVYYIYHDNYKKYMIVTLNKNIVSDLSTASLDWRLGNLGAGSSKSTIEKKVPSGYHYDPKSVCDQCMIFGNKKVQVVIGLDANDIAQSIYFTSVDVSYSPIPRTEAITLAQNKRALDLINAYRVDNGISAIKWDDSIYKAAKEQVSSMSNANSCNVNKSIGAQYHTIAKCQDSSYGETELIRDLRNRPTLNDTILNASFSSGAIGFSNSKDWSMYAILLK